MFKVEPIGTNAGMWGGRGALDPVGGDVGGWEGGDGGGSGGTSAQLCPRLPPLQPVTGLCFIHLNKHADSHQAQ